MNASRIITATGASSARLIDQAVAAAVEAALPTIIAARAPGVRDPSVPPTVVVIRR